MEAKLKMDIIKRINADPGDRQSKDIDKFVVEGTKIAKKGE